MGIFDLINIPLGYLFRFIYLLLKNYGWTLVVFTVVTKTLLLPLSIKQHKSMAKTQALQPRLQELQKKYQYDKEKLNMETMKLYKESGVNPMSGCLPLLIQFPLLIALYNIIRSPLTYVIQLGKHGLPAIDKVIEALKGLGVENLTANNQIGVASAMHKHAAELATKFNTDILTIDFNFFGLDFSQIPQLSFDSWLVLIPLLAGLTTYLSSKVVSMLNGQSSSQNDAANSMKMMTYFFPIMTVIFSISLPAGLGFYWILSNIYQIFQQIILTRFFPAEVPEAPAPKHFREREAERRKK